MWPGLWATRRFPPQHFALLAASVGMVAILAYGISIMRSNLPRDIDLGSDLAEVSSAEDGPASEIVSVVPSRYVASEDIPPPFVGLKELPRVAAREPLSDLAMALPPRMFSRSRWKPKNLYRPFFTDSATFESLGYRISIEGTTPIPDTQLCGPDRVLGGGSPCGKVALGTVRRWIRGRALRCVVPIATDRQQIETSCSLGGQDVGAWLVSNGWAYAVPGGKYAGAERVARNEKMGIFREY